MYDSGLAASETILPEMASQIRRETVDIREVLNLPQLLAVKSVLCVEPHPDDNEVGAGGTVLRLVAEGCKVDFVTVTDGGAGWPSPGLKREDVIETRRQERAKASEILGVNHFYNLGFEDGGSYSEEEVAAKLIPLFRKLRPELVMTVDPWMPYESHPDHLKTGRAVARSLLFCSNPAFMEGIGEPWSVPQVAFYASSYPNTFIDVTATWAQKLEAMLAHKSQFANEEWPLLSEFLRLEAAQLYAQNQGNTGSASVESSSPGLAEAFKVLATRQLHFFPSALYS